MRLLAGVLIAALAIGWSDRALSEGSSRVVIVRPKDAGELVKEATTRLRAEIAVAGFSVEVVDAKDTGDARAEVENDLGREGAAFATIAIVATDRGAVADVWVADHVTKKTLVKRVDAGDKSATAASDLAVRSVELLRASLLEVNATPAAKATLPPDVARWLAGPVAQPPPKSDEPTVTTHVVIPQDTVRRIPLRTPPANIIEPPVPVRPPAAPPPKDDTAVEIAFAWIAGGTFRAAVGPAFRITRDLPLDLKARATFAPFSRVDVTAAEGVVSLGQDLAYLDLATTFGLDSHTAYPFVSAGGGVYHLRVDGKGNAPYVGEQQDFIAGAFVASAGGGVHVVPHLSLLADASMIFLGPEPIIGVAGRNAANRGSPAFFGTIGAAATF